MQLSQETLDELTQSFTSDISKWAIEEIRKNPKHLSLLLKALQSQSGSPIDLTSFNKFRLSLPDDYRNRMDALEVIDSYLNQTPIHEAIADNVTRAWSRMTLRSTRKSTELTIASAIIIDAILNDKIDIELERKDVEKQVNGFYIIKKHIRRGAPQHQLRHTFFYYAAILYESYKKNNGPRGAIKFAMSEFDNLVKIGLPILREIDKKCYESQLNIDWYEELKRSSPITISEIWRTVPSPTELIEVIEYMNSIHIMDDAKEFSKQLNIFLQTPDVSYILFYVDSIPVAYLPPK